MPLFLKYQNPILTYHRINAESGDPTITVSKEAFARQMAFLKERESVISLEGLISLLRSGKDTLPKKLALTFDDGYQELYSQAFPILQRHRLPATVFLVTEWIGRKDFLSWEAVQEMSEAGVVFGSHTKTHAYLPSVSSPGRLEKEIRGSKEFLEDRLGKEVAFLSYPVGGFTEEVKEMVQKAGYQAAFTTNRGERCAKRDLYALSRIKMTDSSTSFLIFKIKTSGYYEQFKRKKKPY